MNSNFVAAMIGAIGGGIVVAVLQALGAIDWIVRLLQVPDPAGWVLLPIGLGGGGWIGYRMGKKGPVK